MVVPRKAGIISIACTSIVYGLMAPINTRASVVLFQAARRRCTVGEISDALEEVQRPGRNYNTMGFTLFYCDF